VKISKKVLMVVCVVAGLLLSSCVEKKIDPPPAKVPTAPSSVVATPGPGYMTVTWKDNSDNETGFVIYRDTGTALQAQAATAFKEVAANTTTFVDTEVSLDTNYSYSVVAKNAEGNSAQPPLSSPAKVAQGVDLLVGTNNRNYQSDANGTIMIAYLMFPKTVLSDPNVTMSIKVTGPAGWNDGEITEYELGSNEFARVNGYDFLSFNGADALEGTYNLEVQIDTTTYKANYELRDGSFELPEPTNITILSSSPNSVSASWDATPGAPAYWVSLWRGNYEELASSFFRVEATTFTFKDLDLEDGIYQVEVAPVNTNLYGIPLKVEPFGLSYETKNFAVGNFNSACSSNDQAISIPDANLQKAIRDALGKATGDLTCLDMALLTELDNTVATEKGISSLEGLEFAINLRDAQLGENAITSAAPLKDLKKLEWLNLNNNQISNLTPFQNLTSLRGLFLSGTSNAYTDISPLAALTQLEMLDIGGHDLGNIDLLADFNNLTRLWTWGNALENEDMTVLEGKALDTLNLDGNTVSDLAFLSNFPDLVEFNGAANGISDISPLKDLTKLEQLEIEENDIADITPLVENTGLGENDFINLDENRLDITDGSDDKNDIDALIARGVNVSFENQKTQ
jgi:hypothetical protein